MGQVGSIDPTEIEQPTISKSKFMVQIQRDSMARE